VLDTENQELSAASTSPEPAALPEESEGPLEQVLRLKSLLLETRALEELEPAFRLPGLEEDLACDGCRSLQERLEALERRGPAPSSSLELQRVQPEELETLRAGREELQGRLAALRARAGEQERELADRQLAILELRRAGAVELEAAEQEGRRAAAGLRLEVQEQRERCLGLLEEKDRELVRLRDQLEAAVEEAFYRPEVRRSTSREGSQSPRNVPLPRRISTDSSLELGRATDSGPPLHYVQELSRKEVEIKELRSQQFMAETAAREIMLTMSAKEERCGKHDNDRNYFVPQVPGPDRSAGGHGAPPGAHEHGGGGEPGVPKERGAELHAEHRHGQQEPHAQGDRGGA
jgi:hypothetical protein